MSKKNIKADSALNIQNLFKKNIQENAKTNNILNQIKRSFINCNLW